MGSHIMKFFAVIPAILAACAAEAQLPIASQYLGAAGLYNGAGVYGSAVPYAGAYGAYAPAAYITAYTATPAITTAAYAPAYAAPVAPYAAAPVAAIAAAPIAGPVSSQFQAQDEFGNVAYGYNNINSAKQEQGNAYGGVTGSYTYQDEAGIHTVNYVADDFGFRVAGDNLPVAPVYSGALPVAPVYTGVAPASVVDTPEVAAAKAEFFKLFDAATTKTKRSADAEAEADAAYTYGFPASTYGSYGYGFPAATNYGAAYGYGLPAATYGAHALAAVAPSTYAAAPALATVVPATYAGAIHASFPALAAVAPAAYAAAPAAYAAVPAAYAAAPAAAAREAIQTTIRLNPGHAIFYRVD